MLFFVQSLSRVFVTPWTVACQALLSMEFSRQGYWSGLPFPVSRHLSNPGINSGLLYCRQILYHQATVFIMDNFWKCYYKTSRSGCYPSFSYRYLGNMNWVDPQRGQSIHFRVFKKKLLLAFPISSLLLLLLSRFSRVRLCVTPWTSAHQAFPWPLKLVHYSLDPENSTKSCKSRGSNIHVHFKSTHEAAQAIKGVHIWKATKYLKAVTLKKQCVPFRYYNSGVGRCTQTKQWGWMKGRWPKKSTEFLLHILKNAESSAELKGLDTLATWCEELTHWKRLWCWERLRAGGEGDDREWVGWMASPTQWTWVWVDSGSWWWTGRPGVLQFMVLQRVGHDWATELNWRA